MLGTSFHPTRYQCLLILILQSAIHGRFGWIENAQFLEQFRYIIVASQLLNESSNPRPYQRKEPPPPADHGIAQPRHQRQNERFVPSITGLVVTGLVAFGLAWSLRSFHSRHRMGCSASMAGFITVSLCFLTLAMYYYLRRQMLHNLRLQAISVASTFAINAQDFDAAAAAGLTLIQEVELVSRGYSM